MQTVSEDLICGACSKLINDPYKLPCGHTFCLRPCILDDTEEVMGRCISCNINFYASELRPDYLVAAKLHLSLQDNSEKENDISETRKGLGFVKGSNQIRCSVCQNSTDEKQLKYCQHCHRNVCPTCLEKHFESYSLQVRIQLTSIQRKETALKKGLQDLKNKLSAAAPGSTHTTKATIISQLDEAISQLKAAASQSLGNALTKVEVLEIDSLKVLKVKSDDFLAGFSDLKEVEKIYEQLGDGTIRKLEDAEKIFLHLRDIKQNARSLLDSFNPLPTLQIMQFRLSNRVQEHIQKLKEIDMIIGCGSVSLSSLPADHGIRNMSYAGGDSSTALISKVKFFVCGLRRTHTEEHLKRYFESKYGPLVDCHVVKDFKTKMSRGYGFVTFKEAIHASRALADFPHFIQGVPIQLKPYKFANADRNKTPFGDASSRQTTHKLPRHRVVVVGISDSTTNDAIKTALSKIGPVISADKESNRGFATVNFEKPETVDRAVLLNRELGKKGSSEHVDELRLFVGNLNPSDSRESLKEHFSRFGNVAKIDIIYNQGSSKPRGIAFVSMSTVQEVEKVLKGCPHILNNNQLIVRKAYKNNSEQRKSLKSTEVHKNTTMIIYDIPANTSHQDLLECFSKFGGITDLTIQDKTRNGILSFASPKALQEALKASSHPVRGKNLRVACYQGPLANYSIESKETLYIRIGDIAPLTTELELRVCLRQFGGVLKASVIKTGTRLHAIVKMVSFEAVQKVVNSKGLKIGGHYVTVRRSYPESRKGLHHATLVRRRLSLPKTSKSGPPCAKINGISEVTKLPSFLKSVSDYYDYIYCSDEDVIMKKDV